MSGGVSALSCFHIASEISAFHFNFWAFFKNKQTNKCVCVCVYTHILSLRGWPIAQLEEAGLSFRDMTQPYHTYNFTHGCTPCPLLSTNTNYVSGVLSHKQTMTLLFNHSELLPLVPRYIY